MLGSNVSKRDQGYPGIILMVATEDGSSQVKLDFCTKTRISREDVK
jgi:hypothetical protein